VLSSPFMVRNFVPSGVNETGTPMPGTLIGVPVSVATFHKVMAEPSELRVRMVFPSGANNAE